MLPEKPFKRLVKVLRQTRILSKEEEEKDGGKTDLELREPHVE